MKWDLKQPKVPDKLTTPSRAIVMIVWPRRPFKMIFLKCTSRIIALGSLSFILMYLYLILLWSHPIEPLKKKTYPIPSWMLDRFPFWL